MPIACSALPTPPITREGKPYGCRRLLSAFLASVFLLCSLGPLGAADLYRWQDDKGVWHIADDLQKVPPAQRDHLRHRVLPEAPASPPSSEDRTAPPEEPPEAAAEETPPPRKTFHIPYERRPGGGLSLAVRINGRAPIPLVLDTGASVTTLSRAAAEHLGISLTGVLPRIRTVTANGTISNYLIRLSSIEVGEARAENVMALVPVRSRLGVNGLLGQNFLNEFDWSNQTSLRLLVLREYETLPGEEIYGGHGKTWWEEKFRSAKEYLAREREILRAMEGYRVQGPIEQDYMDEQIRIQKANVDFFAKELEILDSKANRYMVPRSWR